MIASLKGVVLERDFSEVIIDVNGVGYGINMTVRDVAGLEKGQPASVFVREVVREQAFDLYGFLRLADRDLFDLFLRVSGVGPRLALALLGLGEREALARAVQHEDISYLSRAPGVGRKLAERLCVELRDKLPTSSAKASIDQTDTELDVRAALASLGFKADDIERMSKDVDVSGTVEEQIKQALRER